MAIIEWQPLQLKPHKNAPNQQTVMDSMGGGGAWGNMVTFVQVSDLHLGRGVDGSMERFDRLASHYIAERIRPHLVFVTGDLTDSKTVGEGTWHRKLPFHPSKPLQYQWGTYRDILERAGLWKTVPLVPAQSTSGNGSGSSRLDGSNSGNSAFEHMLDIKRKLVSCSKSHSGGERDVLLFDIRGNHDAYGTLNDEYAKQYSISGYNDLLHDDRRAHVHLHELADGSIVKFLLVDAASEKNYNFPLNFFGELSNSVIEAMERGLNNSAADHTFIMSHYPICSQDPVDHWPATARGIWESKFVRPQQARKDGEITANMNGHIHAHNFYGRLFGTGMLELELADWKYSSYFRVAAVDHGIFSFVDVGMHQIADNPIILVTNPKDSRFLTNTDRWQNMMQSSHVRILIIANAPNTTITSAQVYVDNEMIGDLGRDVTTALSVRGDQSGQMMLTSPWDPTKYADAKQHAIRVTVKDEHGGSNTVIQPFSVDGVVQHANFFSNILHGLSWHTVAYVGILTVYVYVMVWTLLFPRMIGCCVFRRQKNRKMEAERRVVRLMGLNAATLAEVFVQEELKEEEEEEESTMRDVGYYDSYIAIVKEHENTEMMDLSEDEDENKSTEHLPNSMMKEHKKMRKNRVEVHRMGNALLSGVGNMIKDVVCWKLWRDSVVPAWQFWIEVAIGVWLAIGFIFYAPVLDGADGYGFVTAFGVFVNGQFRLLKETIIFFWTPIMFIWAISIQFSHSMAARRRIATLKRMVHHGLHSLQHDDGGDEVKGSDSHPTTKPSRSQIWLGQGLDAILMTAFVSLMTIILFLLYLQIALVQGLLAMAVSPGLWLAVFCTILALPIPSAIRFVSQRIRK